MQVAHITGGGTSAPLQNSPASARTHSAHSQRSVQQSPANAARGIWQSMCQSLSNSGQVISKNSTKIAFGLNSLALFSSTYGDLHDSQALKEVGAYLSTLSLPLVLLSLRSDERTEHDQEERLAEQDGILRDLENRVNELSERSTLLSGACATNAHQVNLHERTLVGQEERLDGLESKVDELDGSVEKLVATHAQVAQQVALEGQEGDLENQIGRNPLAE